MTRSIIATILALALPMAQPALAAIQILHTFTSGAADGEGPRGLLLDGSTLYGGTLEGGLPNGGTIYRLNTDGTGFAVLHSFSGIGTDGQNPSGNLAIDGTTLYGTTGSFGGTVFKMETDGSDFDTLHKFAYPGTQTSPAFPATGVTLSGSTLFGTTAAGGANAGNIPIGPGPGGTVFSLGTDGTGFTLLEEFSAGPPGVNNPRTELTLSGQTLYGMTFSAHSPQLSGGSIYKINTDGTGMTVLHTFNGDEVGTTPIDGAHPDSHGLQLIGNRLYGVTMLGGRLPSGIYNWGTIFGMDIDGNNFEVLHSFGGPADGFHPMGSLAFDGTSLYGVTRGGGAHGGGTLYQINLDGTGYAILHDFAGGAADGYQPDDAGLLLKGKQLYGTTFSGGQYGIGVVYTFALPEPTAAALLALGSVALLGTRRLRL